MSSDSNLFVKQQRAIDWDGNEFDYPQYQIYIEDVLIGYLPWGDSQAIQPLTNFPFEQLDVIISEVGERLYEMHGKRFTVLPPVFGCDVASVIEKQLGDDNGDQ